MPALSPGIIPNPGLAFGLPDPAAQTATMWTPPGVGTGIELGRAQLDTTFSLTATLTAIVGFAVPTVIPPGVNIYVEADFPWIGMGTTSTYVLMQLFEDSTQLKAAITPAIAANGQTQFRIAQSYVPTTTGNHTYLIKASVGVTSSGAIIQGGLVSGLLLSPVLRVVTA